MDSIIFLGSMRSIIFVGSTGSIKFVGSMGSINFQPKAAGIESTQWLIPCEINGHPGGDKFGTY
jgi:hypothetical protein